MKLRKFRNDLTYFEWLAPLQLTEEKIREAPITDSDFLRAHRIPVQQTQLNEAF